MKVIPETRRVHWIWYLRFYYEVKICVRTYNLTQQQQQKDLKTSCMNNNFISILHMKEKNIANMGQLILYKI